MTHVLPGSAQEANIPPYLVEAPRASDAIACALRHAFMKDTGTNDLGLPDDMAALLGRINHAEMPGRR